MSMFKQSAGPAFNTLDEAVWGHCRHPLHEPVTPLRPHRVPKHVEDRLMHDAFAEMDAYRRIGVCSQCGKTSPDDPSGRCTASQDMTGEYTCAGDGLWEDDDV